MARTASIERETNETTIRLQLNLDGTGTAAIKTGVGFLDHMLELLAKHGVIDLEVQATGDLHVDQHHTVDMRMQHMPGFFTGHPYAKAISGWSYCRSTQFRPLADALRAPPDRSPTYHDWGHFTRSQTDGLVYADDDGDGDKLLHADIVFKFENLARLVRFLDLVYDDGPGARLRLPARKRSWRNCDEHRCDPGVEREYYLDATEIRLINERYRRDFEAFGYEMMTSVVDNS